MPITETDMHHLLGLDGMPAEEILGLIDRAELLLPVVRGEQPPFSTLHGQLIANLFLEDSTRTRGSFTVATKRLGGDTVDLTGKGSSASKGESLLDTAKNLEAMGVNGLVIRCSESGGPHLVAQNVDIPVINAGDGRHEHPTQALLDLMTMRQELETLAHKRVAIVGDIAGSRVARSNIFGMVSLGMQVILVGPPDLVHASFLEITSGPGTVEINHDLESILSDIDAIMMLRVQFERHGDGVIRDDYRDLYGLTTARAQKLRPGVKIFHPGPLNRGFEIEDTMADDPERSVILSQVTNGVAIRMAILERGNN